MLDISISETTYILLQNKPRSSQEDLGFVHTILEIKEWQINEGSHGTSR